jgi:hypothetical protein
MAGGGVAFNEALQEANSSSEPVVRYGTGGRIAGFDKSDIKELAKFGRNGDTMLAHINPQEARMLKRVGGSGTINPVTGLPEFMFADDSFDSFSLEGGGGGGGEFGGGSDDSFGYGDFGPGDGGGSSGGSGLGGGAEVTGVNPETGAVKMDFTGMAPGVDDTLNPGDLDFGPGAVFVEPYVAPFVEPYIEPYVAPYVEPYVEPYVAPYVAPFVEPYIEPYVAPYVEPYVEPYVAPT